MPAKVKGRPKRQGKKPNPKKPNPKKKDASCKSATKKVLYVNLGKTPPPGWGEDKLTESLETGYGNQWGSFSNKQNSPIFAGMMHVHHLFYMLTMKYKTTGKTEKDLQLFACFARSYAAYYGACKLVLSTQLGEYYALLRLSLECAGYALLLQENKPFGRKNEKKINRLDIWINRQRDINCLVNSKYAFSKIEVQKQLNETDEELGRVYDTLYNHAIDFGAHPSYGQSVTNSDMDSLEKELRQFVYRDVSGKNEGYLDGALINLLVYGFCSLLVFKHIDPIRMSLVFPNDFPRERGPGEVATGLKKVLYNIADQLEQTRCFNRPEDFRLMKQIYSLHLPDHIAFSPAPRPFSPAPGNEPG